MASVTFNCARCGEEETLSDPLIVDTGNTEEWLCHKCIDAIVVSNAARKGGK